MRQRLLVLLTVLTVMVIAVGASFWAYCYALQAETNVRYAATADIVTEDVEKTIRGMEMNARNVFDEVEKHLDTPETVIAALESKTSLNPDVKGYFAAFRLNYFPEKGQWFEPYVHRSDERGYELTQVGSARHDYTKSPWYIKAEKKMSSFWSDPYFYYDGTSISGHYCTYVLPLTDRSGELVCVCGADITLEWLSDELARIDDSIKHDEQLNEFPLMRHLDFFSVVIDKDGSCIIHPEGKNVLIKDLSVIEAINQHKSGVTDLIVDDVSCKVYYAPIEGIDWSVAVVVPKFDILKPFLFVGFALLLLTLLGTYFIYYIIRRYVYEKK